MGTLIIISQFVLALAILITLHELGHFMAARAFGIRVEKFYLFFDAFGFKLFSFKKGDTEYGIGWLPLGGYVKIAGMIDESLDANQMKSEPQPWEFRAKPAWQRLIVMVGGVVVNLILGLFIFIMMAWSQGESFVPMKAVNDKGGIYAGPVARKLGFRHGDKVISFNGKPVESVDFFSSSEFINARQKSVLVNRGDKDTTLNLPENLEESFDRNSDLPFVEVPMLFKVDRVTKGSNASKAGIKTGDMIVAVNGIDTRVFFLFKEALQANKDKDITADIVTEKEGTKKVTVHVEKDGTIGFMPNLFGYESAAVVHNYNLGQSISKGTSFGFGVLGTNIKALGKVVGGKVSAKKSIAGPVGIAQMFGDRWIWIRFWTLTGMLSLVLAFMNILPIPALDGGHVMFLLWEIITRRPVSEKVLYIGQIIGMLLLGALMVFIFWVDISRALGF